MHVQRIEDGLWRWTVPHPAWVPDGTGSAAWPRDVGCVYYEAPAATVVVDPLAPPADAPEAARFWAALDRDVERRGAPVHVLRTLRYHERSCGAVRDRYGASDALPDGVTGIPLGDPGDEWLVWLPGARTLVVGDILLGGPLRVCPPSWHDGDADDRAWYRDASLAALERLLALAVERVLPSHGDPVLEGGHAALVEALERHRAVVARLP